ncbi:hypothetical protein [Oceanobacillus neutriphilus]|uniref:hypothetical protein n=1 Tax=Oceanobacillus neutriphilus TaxID=531815 RepID=UPI001E4D52C0|nr:hypothetical protein [Oceanobacillus neutriphilus]
MNEKSETGYEFKKGKGYCSGHSTVIQSLLNRDEKAFCKRSFSREDIIQINNLFGGG